VTRVRLIVTVVAACLVGAVLGVLLFGGDDTAGPGLAERTTPAPSAPGRVSSVARSLDPGEVWVIVSDDDVRLRPRTVRRRGGLLTIAIDNLTTRRVEVALVRRGHPSEAATGLPASGSVLNQIPVPAGRYRVIARAPTAPAADPVAGFAEASLRVR